MDHVLSFDPGLNGALCLYAPEKRIILRVNCLPRLKSESSHDLKALHLMLKSLPHPDISLVAIEKVHSRPGQSSQSTFTFGRVLGQLEGALSYYDLPAPTYISPVAWKAAFKLSADKSRSLNLVRSLFPAYKDHFARNRDEGKAEALLLAVYASLYLSPLS